MAAQKKFRYPAVRKGRSTTKYPIADFPFDCKVYLNTFDRFNHFAQGSVYVINGREIKT